MKKLASFAGIIGPILFAIILVTLTILEYDFLRGLGWDPIYAPTFDWPSGLSLGPYGMWMIGTFTFCGFCMSIFALALRADLQPAPVSNIGTSLMVCAGRALMGLAFLADPAIRSTPATWHGRLHDLSFVLLGLTLLPAMILLGRTFQLDPRWQNLSHYTWLTVSFAIPTFALKGFAFYVFMLAILIWSEVVAFRLLKRA